MNIIEAIKSGKPFSQPGRDWINLSKDGYNSLTLSVGDLISDDWITKQGPREFWLARRKGELLHVFLDKPESDWEDIIRVQEVISDDCN